MSEHKSRLSPSLFQQPSIVRGIELRCSSRLDGYDYLYKRAQLGPWVSQIKEAEIKVTKVRIYFSNRPLDNSVRNAFLLMDLLLIEHKQK